MGKKEVEQGGGQTLILIETLLVEILNSLLYILYHRFELNFNMSEKKVKESSNACYLSSFYPCLHEGKVDSLPPMTETRDHNSEMKASTITSTILLLNQPLLP